VKTPTAKGMEELLKRARFSFNINVKKFVIGEYREKDLKLGILWGLPLAKNKDKTIEKVKISLFSTCCFGNDKSITFYPQARIGQEIMIKDFIDKLLKGNIKRLHKKVETEDYLKGVGDDR